MNTAITETLPMDLHVIAIDETEYWTMPEHMSAVIGRIEQLYYYDANRVTYCCEMTPSYWLEAYDVRFIPKSGCVVGDDLDERIYDTLRQHADLEGTYYHCHNINGLIKRYQAEGVNFRYRHIGSQDVDPEVDYDEQFMYIREGLCSNAPM